MAKKADIGAKIGIEGEKEFREQIKQINTGLKTLSTESKLVTSEFIGQEESTAALTKQNAVLDKEIAALNTRLEAEREYLKKATEAGAGFEEAQQAAQQNVNKTQTQINKLTAQLENNTKAIKENENAEKNNTGQAGAASAAMGKLNGALSGVAQSLGLSREQTDALSSAFNGGGNLSLAVAGAAAAAGITLIVKAVKAVGEAMKEAVNEASDYADSVNTLSLQTGLSTDFLQGLEYASKLVDVSSESITSAIRNLKKNLFSESKEVQKAWETLKLDPNLFIYADTPIEEVFANVIKGLSLIENELERDNVAQKLFGKGYQELAGVIDDGGEKLYSLIQKYEDLGYILSEDDLQALQALDDQFVEVENAMTAAKNQIAKELAPELTELAKQLLEVAQTVDWPAFGRAAADVIRDLGPLIIDLAKSIADTANALAKLMENISAFKKTDAGKAVNGVFGALSNTGIVGAIKNLPANIAGVTSGVAGVSGLLTSGSSNQSAQAQQPIVVQSSITLDGQTIGRAVTPVVNTRNTQRGRTF